MGGLNVHDMWRPTSDSNHRSKKPKERWPIWREGKTPTRVWNFLLLRNTHGNDCAT